MNMAILSKHYGFVHLSLPEHFTMIRIALDHILNMASFIASNAKGRYWTAVDVLFGGPSYPWKA